MARRPALRTSALLRARMRLASLAAPAARIRCWFASIAPMCRGNDHNSRGLADVLIDPAMPCPIAGDRVWKTMASPFRIPGPSLLRRIFNHTGNARGALSWMLLGGSRHIHLADRCDIIADLPHRPGGRAA